MSAVLTGARYSGTDREGARWTVGDLTLTLSAVTAGVARVRLCAPEASWESAVAAPQRAPASVAAGGDGGWTVELDGLHATLQGAPLALAWEVDGAPLLVDHPSHAYALRGASVVHRQVRFDGERLLGLGEVSGGMERTGRRYRLEPRDALGYDAELGDPLYKHWPVLLLARPDGRWAALVYDVPFPMTFDLGAEVHNYLGPFRYADVDGPGLDYYVLAAPDLPALVRRLTALLGRPPLPPRWSLGYLASGMAYADADDPEAALVAFADRCRREGIPCDGMHLSSGYTLRQGRRYVFTWSERIADPHRLVGALAERGLRVVANVKPGMLEDHPDYRFLAQRGAFLRDATGAPLRGDFWGGPGSFLDFTNEEALRYWRDRVTTRLLDAGIEGIWNDNNEFAAEDAVTAAGEPAYPAVQMRAMARASYQACRDARPERRPFVISRSASLGVQRLAQTWSGDNRSSWHALRFNTAMGLSLGLSGFANHGHDVGGFAGAAPDAELFLRWVQQGVFYPRFVIHSWKEPPTEPWSHPEVLPAVRQAIALRYKLLPYLYSLFHEHAETGAPPMRPLVYAFDTDEAFDQPFSFLLGPAILVPGEAFVPGAREAEVRLLGGRGWYDLDGTRLYPPGIQRVAFPLERVPALVQAGSILPLAQAPGAGHGPGAAANAVAGIEAGRAGAAANADPGTAEPNSPRTGSAAGRGAPVGELRLYPHPGEGVETFRLYLDDGESLAYQRGERTVVELRLRCDRRTIAIEAEALERGYPWQDGAVTLRLPAGESRSLRPAAGFAGPRAETLRHGWRELVVDWDLDR